MLRKPNDFSFVFARSQSGLMSPSKCKMKMSFQATMQTNEFNTSAFAEGLVLRTAATLLGSSFMEWGKNHAKKLDTLDSNLGFEQIKGESCSR